MVWLRVNPFPNKPWFLRVCSTSLLKTPWEKEKLLIMSNFSFSHSVFYSFRELSIKLKIVIGKLSVSKSLKFVVWERVKESCQSKISVMSWVNFVTRNLSNETNSQLQNKHV